MMKTSKIIFVVMTILFGRLVMIRGQTADMSRFNSLKESDTCFQQDIRYDEIGSIFLKGNFLHIFYDAKTGDKYEMTIQHDKGNIYENEPVYNVRFSTDLRKLEQSKHTELYEKYLNKFKTTYYYPVKKDAILFVFDDGGSELNIAVPYVIADDKGQIFNQTEIDKGTIAMMHQLEDSNDDQLNQTLFATALIGNKNYKYETGWLKFEPLNFQMDHSYYYGFNKNLDRIYFAKEFSELSKISNYLPPAELVDVSRWHPFRCYRYIYLTVGEWVFIFPYLNITEQSSKLNNPSIMQAEMTVMHLNTFFRCSDPSGNNTNDKIPHYPSLEFSIHNLSPSDENSMSTVPALPEDLLIYGAIGVTAVIVILVLFIVICKRKKSLTKLKTIINKNKQQQQQQKNPKPTGKKLGKKSADKKSKVTPKKSGKKPNKTSKILVKKSKTSSKATPTTTTTEVSTVVSSIPRTPSKVPTTPLETTATPIERTASKTKNFFTSLFTRSKSKSSSKQLQMKSSTTNDAEEAMMKAQKMQSKSKSNNVPKQVDDESEEDEVDGADSSEDSKVHRSKSNSKSYSKSNSKSVSKGNRPAVKVLLKSNIEAVGSIKSVGKTLPKSIIVARPSLSKAGKAQSGQIGGGAGISTMASVISEPSIYESKIVSNKV